MVDIWIEDAETHDGFTLLDLKCARNFKKTVVEYMNELAEERYENGVRLRAMWLMERHHELSSDEAFKVVEEMILEASLGIGR
jgi:hypothetical protein